MDIDRDSLQEILLNLSLNDLYHSCRVEKRFASICSDDNFWKLKGKRDFGPFFMEFFKRKMHQKSHKFTYQILREIQKLRLEVGWTFVSFEIFIDDLLIPILNVIRDLFREMIVLPFQISEQWKKNHPLEYRFAINPIFKKLAKEYPKW